MVLLRILIPLMLTSWYYGIYLMFFKNTYMIWPIELNLRLFNLGTKMQPQRLALSTKIIFQLRLIIIILWMAKFLSKSIFQCIVQCISLTFFSLSNLNLAGCSGTRYLTWTTTRNVITRSIWAKCEGAGTCRSSSTTYSGTTGTRFRSRSRWFFTISLKKLLMKALHR